MTALQYRPIENCFFVILVFKDSIFSIRKEKRVISFDEYFSIIGIK